MSYRVRSPTSHFQNLNVRPLYMPSGHVVGREDYQSYLVDKTTMTSVYTSATGAPKREFISLPGREGALECWRMQQSNKEEKAISGRSFSTKLQVERMLGWIWGEANCLCCWSGEKMRRKAALNWGRCLSHPRIPLEQGCYGIWGANFNFSPNGLGHFEWLLQCQSRRTA